jgi:hypothetical protein
MTKLYIFWFISTMLTALCSTLITGALDKHFYEGVISEERQSLDTCIKINTTCLLQQSQGCNQFMDEDGKINMPPNTICSFEINP